MADQPIRLTVESSGLTGACLRVRDVQIEFGGGATTLRAQVLTDSYEPVGVIEEGIDLTQFRPETIREELAAYIAQRAINLALVRRREQEALQRLQAVQQALSEVEIPKDIVVEVTRSTSDVSLGVEEASAAEPVGIYSATDESGAKDATAKGATAKGATIRRAKKAMRRATSTAD